MSVLKEYFAQFGLILSFGIYGWLIFLPFLIVLIYMFWWLKRDSNRTKFDESIEWMFLEVKVDELNEKSPLAMEQVFAALHAIHTGSTWGEDFAGKTVLYLSCEIVSLGGKVSYIFKIPRRFRALLESAIFAQYPKAEVVEIQDYLKNLPHHYDPATAEFDFHGTQWLKKKDNAYPIRTYAQDSSYEHSVQETIIDPLANVLEVMSNLQPYELLAYQVVIKPLDDTWKEHTQHIVDELKGVPHKHESSLFNTILFFIPDLLASLLVSIITPASEEGARSSPSREQPEQASQMLHKTDVEKMVINAIEHAKSKVSYDARIRTLYLAPKGKLNKALRLPEIVGAFRNFDDVNLNGIKPDIGHTWTDKAFKISEKLERPYLDFNILIRKRHLWHNFLDRSSWRGSGQVIMNTEELATIYHFPQTPNARVSQLERVSAVKAAPPMDLPIK